MRKNLEPKMIFKTNRNKHRKVIMPLSKLNIRHNFHYRCLTKYPFQSTIFQTGCNTLVGPEINYSMAKAIFNEIKLTRIK